MPNFVDITGQKFGRLLAVRYVGKDKAHKSIYLCKCDCGKEIIVRSNNLLSGTTKSCGCAKIERAKQLYKLRKPKHGRCIGGTGDRLYNIWKTMIARCEHKQSKDFARYGGRGISVCPEWHDVNVFAEWALASGYSDKLLIDRIDNNGNYEPSNCRWATCKQQARNTRRTPYVLGRPLADWCDILVSVGEDFDRARQRIRRRIKDGWDEYLAIFTPALPYGRKCYGDIVR